MEDGRPVGWTIFAHAVRLREFLPFLFGHGRPKHKNVGLQHWMFDWYATDFLLFIFISSPREVHPISAQCALLWCTLVSVLPSLYRFPPRWWSLFIYAYVFLIVDFGGAVTLQLNICDFQMTSVLIRSNRAHGFHFCPYPIMFVNNLTPNVIREACDFTILHFFHKFPTMWWESKPLAFVLRRTL